MLILSSRVNSQCSLA